MSRCRRGRCPRSCDRSQGDHDGQPDFDAGRSRGAFWAVDVLEGAGTGTSYDRFVHFDYKPPRTEDTADVCETARACMRNYLIIRDRVRAFRADPEVKAALEAPVSPSSPARRWPTTSHWTTDGPSSMTTRLRGPAACTSNGWTSWPWNTC
jgi:hypothetical protein